jgi:hypothetical protein
MCFIRISDCLMAPEISVIKITVFFIYSRLMFGELRLSFIIKSFVQCCLALFLYGKSYFKDLIFAQVFERNWNQDFIQDLLLIKISDVSKNQKGLLFLFIIAQDLAFLVQMLGLVILIFSDPSRRWKFEAKINNWLFTDYFEFLIQKMTSKITQNFIILILIVVFLFKNLSIFY